MPRLWTETIDTHRRAVREATLDATAALVDERGVLAVSMTQIAERAGIGRATLYKYFPDLGSILVAWHERQVGRHLAQLTAICERDAPAIERLATVLESYGRMAHGPHGTEPADVLHATQHVTDAQQALSELLERLLSDAVASGEIRDDIAPDELASFCLHALGGAGHGPGGLRRRVELVLSGLRPT